MIFNTITIDEVPSPISRSFIGTALGDATIQVCWAKLYRPQDISKKHTGTISGVGNTMATFASMLSPMLAGTVIQVGWEDSMGQALWQDSGGYMDEYR